MGRVEVCVKEVGEVVGVLQELGAIWRNKIFWSFGTCHETNKKTMVDTISYLLIQEIQ